MSRYRPPVAKMLRLQGCRVDLSTGAVTSLDGADTGRLSPAERGLLAHLAERAGEEVERSVLLLEVWGYSEAVVSRTVDTTMRRLRRKVEVDPARPRHLHTIRGVGYRFEPWPSLDAPSPAPAVDRSLAPPVALTPLIGRHEDRLRVTERVRSRRLVTLTGPGGVGKTRLALAVAADLQAELSHVAVCSLPPVRDADGVRAALNGALGLSAESPASAAEHVLAQAESPLVVVDNAEHVVVPVARLLASLLHRLPALRVLVTSRQALRVHGEAVVPLGPLAPEEAGELLLERARDAGVDHVPPELVSPLVARLDHLPLAIELAAARLDDLDPAELLAQLDDRFGLLASDWVDAPARQATLWGAIDWSWSRLAPVEQRALARLGLLQGTVPLDGAAVLAGGRQQVRALRRKSLVQVTERRLSLLESVRDFARSHLPEARAAVAPAWSRWLLDRAAHHRSRLDSADHAAARSGLHALRDDLLALWDRHRSSSPDVACEALLLLRPLLSRDAELQAARSRFREAVALDTHPAIHAELRLALAELSLWRRSRESGVADSRQALEAATSVQRADLMAQAHLSLSLCVEAPEDKVHHTEQALRLARPLGGEVLSDAILEAATAAVSTNRADAGRALLEEGLALTADRPVARAHFLRRLGQLDARQGQVGRGVARLREAIEVYRLHQRTGFEGWALNELGIQYLERSNNREAERWFRLALDRLRKAGSATVSAVQSNLAAVLHQERNFDEARVLYRAALDDIARTERTFEIALTHTNLGGMELLALRLPEARHHLEAGLAAAARMQAGWVESLASASMGGLALAEGRLDEARAVLHRGLALATDGGWLRMATYNGLQQVVLALADERPQDARRALDAAARCLEQRPDASLEEMLEVRRVGVDVALGEPVEVDELLLHPVHGAAVALWLGRPAPVDSLEALLADRYG